MPTLEENLRLRAALRTDLRARSGVALPEDIAQRQAVLRGRVLLDDPRALRDLRLPSGATLRPRSGAEIGLGPALASARVRLWPFTIRDATANATHRISSPVFAGPAVLDEIQMRLSGGGALNSVAWGLWVDEGAQDVSNSDLALTADPPGSPIFEPTRGVGDSAENLDGRFLHNAPLAEESQSDRRWPLNVPVTYDRFRVTVSIRNNTAVTTAAYGYLRVVEGVDLSAWSPFG